MIEEIYKNIFRIHVPLKGNPLRELNSYYIKGDDRELLIDTGFRRDDCINAIRDALKELGTDPSRVDVALTHFHADHSGNVERIISEGRQIFMSEADLDYYLRHYRRLDEYRLDDPMLETTRFIAEGLPAEIILEQFRSNPAFRERMVNPYVLNFTKMHDGDTIKVGDYTFTWVLTPGHTPGNSMLYEANHKIMFTGDNILFTITPNITAWTEFEDSLGNYLESLDKSEKFDVKLAFPGHREIENCDYYARIKSLKEHHKRRLAEALNVIKANPGLHAVDIAGKMTWKIKCNSWEEFPSTQKFFAVGECFSHLDYLMKRDLVYREYDGKAYKYYAK